MPSTAGFIHLEILDIPALRDKDLCDPLYYWAVAYAGLTGEYRGMALYESLDDVTYELAAITGDRAVLGVTEDSTLGDPPTECPKWDESSTVDVRLLTADGALSSTTALRVMQGANRAVIGNELVAFRDVVAQGDNVYTLSGFLRGLRGTREDLADKHGIGDRFVLLQRGGLNIRYYNRANVDTVRWFKAVPVGGDPLDYTGRAVSLTARNMRPFAPTILSSVDLGTDRTITWKPRPTGVKRITRIVEQCTCCCGDGSYDLEIRTKADTDVVSFTYPGIVPTSLVIPEGDRTDAGYGASEAITIHLYQNNCAIGRGIARIAVV